MHNYKYYNHNPEKVHSKDCVCRAISTATGIPYEGVYNLLELVADGYNCEMLCVCCYHHLLEDVLCYRKFDGEFKCTVKEVSLKYPNNTIIIRVPEHLTCSVNGVIMDIWDCSNELVDCFWIVK